MTTSKAIPNNWIDSYFTYGVDKGNRRIFLDGEITTQSAQYIRRGILYLDSLDSKRPIELWICSDGGDIYSMFSIYDTLRTVKCPIHTIATGMCMSAAPLLVAAGEIGERYATPNCYFMVHQFWDPSPSERIDVIEIGTRHSKDMLNRWGDLMEEHTSLDKRAWFRKIKKVGDTYFDAEKALEYSLIDQIWSEKDAVV